MTDRDVRWETSRRDRKDLLRAMGLAGGYLLPPFLGPGFDRVVVRILEQGIHRLRPHKLAQLAATMTATLGETLDEEGRDPGEAALEQARLYYAMAAESGWARVRAAYRGGWNPDIEVQGLESLRAARAQGRGVILWRLPFCSSLVPKIVLARAGIPVVHLSRWSHGTWGDSLVARHVTYPLFHRTEDHYLEERIVIPRGNSLAYMKVLIDRLSRGAVLSIFGDLAGRQNVTVRAFGMDAVFPRGAPSLAWKVGSVLLPVYAIRLGPSRYRVVFEDPVAVERNDLEGKAGRDAFVEAAVHEFALRLSETLARHAGSWQNWEPPVT